MRKIFTLLIVAILATATFWAAEKTILLQNIGESASATSTESVSQVTVKASGTSDSYTLNYLHGKKQDKSILLAKSTGAFISFLIKRLFLGKSNLLRFTLTKEHQEKLLIIVHLHLLCA